MLTVAQFAILGVGFLASVNLNCEAKGTVFTINQTYNSFVEDVFSVSVISSDQTVLAESPYF
jgi:hypothetical protein